MSVIADTAAAPGGESSAAAAPDVSGESSTPESSIDTASSDNGGSEDVFADQTFDKAFGLQPEEKKADAKPDVPPATDQPANRQGEKIEKEDAGEPAKDAKPDDTDTDKSAAAAKATDTDEPKNDGQFQANEKLNWDDDKVPFRNEFTNLKKAYLELAENSVEGKFISDPKDFASWMKETSDTSFNEVGKLLATESAQNHPKEWIEYLAKNNPDLVAEVISGREGMTAERLKAELDVLLDDDDQDVEAALEKRKAEKADADKAKPVETPEQKRVREILERDDRDQHTRMVSEVFQPVEQAVDTLVSEAGLEIKDSDVAGKRFDELDEDTQFKVLVNELTPLWIDLRVKQDPKLLSMQGRLEEFLKNKDTAGAKKLQHPMSIAATNFTSELISLLTGRRATTKKSETQIPNPIPPKQMVKSASASNGFVADDGDKIDWSGN